MIIIDTALEAREAEGRPIRVALFGAGFMARGITNQMLHSARGMRLVAIFNRTVQKAIDCYTYADELLDPRVVDTQLALDEAILGGRPVVTDDAMLLCRSPHIDVLVDVTGAVEFGAHVVLEAFRNGKHVILMNAELDATLGPILQIYAKRHGVILSACDGDQPAVEINLYRFVKGLGLIPRVMVKPGVCVWIWLTCPQLYSNDVVLPFGRVTMATLPVGPSPVNQVVRPFTVSERRNTVLMSHDQDCTAVSPAMVTVCCAGRPTT